MIKNAQQIIDSADIQEVVSKFVDLKRQGNNYKGCCPFHQEKTPSFIVNPAKNIFKCFGCGEGGNAIHFLMENQKMTFPEALEYIANMNNIPIEYDNQNRSEFLEQSKQDKILKESFYILLKNSFELYYRTYWKKPLEEITKLQGREYRAEIIQEFGLCITPSKALVFNEAQKENWNINDLRVLGISVTGEFGPYDVFKSRLLFPIWDQRGRIVGFGGRKLRNAKKELAKYINSRESLVYKKEEVLYGLWQNKRKIAEKDFAYLVEGYTDVISLKNFGVENAVATCGTALTSKKANQI